MCSSLVAFVFSQPELDHVIIRQQMSWPLWDAAAVQLAVLQQQAKLGIISSSIAFFRLFSPFFAVVMHIVENACVLPTQRSDLQHSSTPDSLQLTAGGIHLMRCARRVAGS